MKKILTILLLLTTVIILTGCKKDEEEIVINYDDLTEYGYHELLNEDNPDITIKVKDYGTIVLQLFPEIAPMSVNNFIQYIEDEAFTNNEFHRVIEGFMIQGGKLDNPACNIKGEFNGNGIINDLRHTKGVLSMARVGGMNDSQTSQFFIMHEAAASLDTQYAAFGGVIAGFDVVDAIAKMQQTGTEVPSEKIEITSITVDLKGKSYDDRVCASDYVAPPPEINVPEEGEIILSELPYYEFLNDTNPVVSITVKDVGTMVFELFPNEAPNTVNNFINHVNDSTYDGNEFYYTLADVLLRGGYVSTTTCKIDAEVPENGVQNDVLMRRGVLSMSRDSDDINTAMSEFFILATDYESIDNKYTGFGGLISGFNVLDYLTNLQVEHTTRPLFDLTFESIEITLNGYQVSETICNQE